mgnify:CR=1 FL=1
MSVTRFSIPLSFESADALVQGVREGDARARSAFYDAHAPGVARALSAVLGPDPELADVLHETFMHAYDAIDHLRETERVGAWIRQIAVHRARACIRRRRRFRLLHVLGLAPEHDVACPRAASPETREALVETYRVLGEMSADLRVPFALRHIEGLELTEVASACDTSLATIKRRLQAAEARFSALARRSGKLDEWLAEGRFA